MYRIRLRLSLAALAAFATSCAPAEAQRQFDRNACLEEQYGEWMQLNREYERNLASIVVRLHPDLRDVATVALDERIALIDARQRVFEAVLDSAPQRLNLDGPVMSWLREPAPSIAEMERLGTGPRAIVSKHPDWPRLEQVLASGESSRQPDFEGPAVKVYTAGIMQPRCGP